VLADLDHLLRQRDIDTLIVPMHEVLHPSFRWITRNARVTRGYAVKRVGEEPILVSYPMEREEAAATGLATRLIHDFDFDRIFKSAPNSIVAYGELYDRILRDLGCGPNVLFAGNLPIHLYLGIADELQRRGWNVVRGNGDDVIQFARKRKETWEIEAIASVGARTEEVVDVVRAILREAIVEGDHVLHRGEVLTLGFLKNVISDEIAKRGMLEEDTILSQGRDAGIPHSRGDARAIVRPSQPIVLDIFPIDRSSGYFFDMTRTFCVGPIPGELARIHGEVLEAFELAAKEMTAGTPAPSYQALVCDYFESHGYETTRSNPTTLSGYVHSLGHGVGLDIHERPAVGISPTNNDMIEVGDVVTIEPGLYFPERAIGVRIEDTFVVRENGRVETLCRSGRGLEP